MKRSVTSAAGIIAFTLAILAGTSWRSRVDRSSDTNRFTIDAMLASKSKDQDVGVVDFFHEMSRLLKREYVDPAAIEDQKLASGAVRGMVGSLGDPNSLYFDKDQFRLYEDERAGKFEGIGAEFALRMDAPPGKENRAGILPSPEDEDAGPGAHAIRIPKLVVTAVVPNGPAAKAGVEVGDVVSVVDSHWLVDAKTIQDLQDARSKFQAGKLSREAYAAIHKDVRLRLETSMLPLRAAQRLSSGLAGSSNIVWKRHDASRQTKIEKGTSAIPTFEADGSSIKALLFVPGNAEKLKNALKSGNMTIDLRNNVNGDFSEMRKCLAAVAPAGTYGYVVGQRDRKASALTISEGNSKPPKLQLLVDQSTAGAAEIFAMALQSKGLAKVTGLAMSPDKDVVGVFGLPDGSGYTLVKGKFTLTQSQQKHTRLVRPPQIIYLDFDTERGDA